MTLLDSQSQRCKHKLKGSLACADFPAGFPAAAMHPLAPVRAGIEADCGFVCAAFPSLIPERIAADRYDHRRPHPDDQGIRWEPREPGVQHPMDESK